MAASKSGSFHLFKFAGIDVFLHWSWFIAAVYELSSRSARYSSLTWNLGEYLILFAIVLMHEFGHSLACRSVGGRAEQIVLWPLGGVAFVSPPPRPGANLWSIAAGPLVNVVLLMVLQVLDAVSRSSGWAYTAPDLATLIRDVWWINAGLLFFNVLPVYPLDGGQILRSLLWFFLGPARSLLVASILGFFGVAGLVALIFWLQPHDLLWPILIAGFLLLNCWNGLKHARQLAKIEALPRRTGCACPGCHKAPPASALWSCNSCRQPFDPFASLGRCPHCGAVNTAIACPDCGEMHPLQSWDQGPPILRPYDPREA